MTKFDDLTGDMVFAAYASAMAEVFVQRAGGFSRTVASGQP